MRRRRRSSDARLRRRGGAVRPLHRGPRGDRRAARRGTRHDADPALRPPARDGRAGHRRARTDRRSRPARPAVGLRRRRRADLGLCDWPRGIACRSVRLIGVEPEAGNDVQQSLARGEIVHIDVPRTIADGAQTQHAGRYTFPVIQALVSQVVTVTDDQLVNAMRFFGERMKIVVEPTGCLGAAAAARQRGRRSRQTGGRDPQRRQHRPAPLRRAGRAGALARQPRKHRA